MPTASTDKDPSPGDRDSTEEEFVKVEVDSPTAAKDRDPPISSSSGMKIKSALKGAFASPGKQKEKKMDSVAFERPDAPQGASPSDVRLEEGKKK